MGARIGEIEEMCAPLQDAAKAPDAVATQAFRDSFVRMADKLCVLADEDRSRGRMLSAGEKLNRAAIYLLTAERLLGARGAGPVGALSTPSRLVRRGSTTVGRELRAGRDPVRRQASRALYVRAEGVTGRAPLLVQINGLDSTKEMKYRVGLPAWLARRGVSSLVVDQPGTGEALRPPA
jgi:hypothetical protein